MNKKIIIWIAVLFLVLVLIFPAKKLFVIDNNKSPGFIGSYESMGYYTFDPRTILAATAHGKTNVFIPFAGNPDDITLDYGSVDWSSADYLKIANLLSQQIWNEPLDLDRWDVYRVYFESGCKDNLQGFNEFSIVYYKSLGIKNWERKYDARAIDIFLWRGFIRWGGDTVFSTPLLSTWHNNNWLNFKITPVNATQIADQNGGKEERLQVQNACSIIVGMFQDRPEIWDVEYPQAYLRMDVDANSGASRIQYKAK